MRTDDRFTIPDDTKSNEAMALFSLFERPEEEGKRM